MKFSEMPYERIDFDAAKEELSSIIKEKGPKRPFFLLLPY